MDLLNETVLLKTKNMHFNLLIRETSQFLCYERLLNMTYVDLRVGIFLEPLNTNDRFFFSNTTTVRYSTVLKILLVTSLRSMFTVNDARCLKK